MIKSILMAALVTLGTLSNLNAQQHGNTIVRSNTAPQMEKQGTILQSHIKSLGGIGNRYEIFSAKSRGLFEPNLTALLAFDSVSGELAVIGTSGGMGMGPALVGAGAEIGSAAVFGRAIRPARYNSQDVTVASGGEAGDSYSLSSSEGASATGGNATGGEAISNSSSNNENLNANDNTSQAHSDNYNAQENTQTQTNNNQNKNHAPKPPKSPKPGKGPKQ